ncbi:MAG: Unknown protein [uncultured Sulfurovum sp.]|uniref:Pentapeptide repeat-containing protein n=1 Tax=uncultured Sulfurovum sp. TaxID=269237 RepID=A0A6S6SYD7_9BACT|nr:MAG: Unknown protein [uncultured Sulfurovum sp.]
MNFKNDLFELVTLFVAFVLLLGLYDVIEFKSVTIIQVLQGLAGVLTIYLVYLRFKTTDNIQKETARHFAIDNEFKSFIESTKLLTDKDSSVAAKISALYLLYDLSKIHPKKTARIIQVINKELQPLFMCIENSCSEKTRTKRLTKLKKQDRKKILFYEYENQDLLSFNIDNISLIQTIKEWRYKGNNTQKIISVALDIIKKISITTLQNEKKYIDMSNSIIFDVDVTFNKGLKFKSPHYPTENLIFLNCVLTDENDFSNTTYHNSKFINCNLSNASFKNANLWGSSFINCNLNDTNFYETECEGVEFKKCKNLNLQQINEMKFKGKTERKVDYLFIISEEDGNDLELAENSYFKTVQEYNSWKNCDKNY